MKLSRRIRALPFGGGDFAIALAPKKQGSYSHEVPSELSLSTKIEHFIGLNKVDSHLSRLFDVTVCNKWCFPCRISLIYTAPTNEQVPWPRTGRRLASTTI
jgi:hypothetical protein